MTACPNFLTFIKILDYTVDHLQRVIGKCEIMIYKVKVQNKFCILEWSLSIKSHCQGYRQNLYAFINIRVAFHYMNEDMITKLFVSIIEPRLEDAALGVVSTQKKEKYQKEKKNLTTVPSMRPDTLKKRLERLGLPTLEERKERGDFFATFRVVKET